MIIRVMKARTLVAAIAIASVLPGCYRSFAREALPDVDDDPEPDLPDFAVDPGTDEWVLCHDRLFDVRHGLPDVLVLLDRSNSMCDNDGRFWRPAVRAVEATSLEWEDQIAFGLAVFPTRLCMPGSFMCIPTSSVDVPCARRSAAEIDSVLSTDTSQCCGGTPLAESLEFAERWLGDLADGRNHHLLLVTDGAPNCNAELDRYSCACTYSAGIGCSGDPDSLNCLDDLRSVGSAAALLGSGVPVHVIGLSEAAVTWSWVMDDIARAGGTGEALLAESPGSIAEAMESIASDVAPCRFEFEPGEILGPDSLTFLVGGVEVPWDPSHEDGWDWLNAWTVDFHGPACDRIVEGGVDVVTARVNCAP